MFSHEVPHEGFNHGRELHFLQQGHPPPKGAFVTLVSSRPSFLAKLGTVFTRDFQDYVESRDRTYFRTRDHFSDYAEAKARDPSRSKK